MTALGEVCLPFVTLLLPVSVLSPEELRKLSWSGVPKPVRAVTWKLLSVSLPGLPAAPLLCRDQLPGPGLGPAAHAPALSVLL